MSAFVSVLDCVIEVDWASVSASMSNGASLHADVTVSAFVRVSSGVGADVNVWVSVRAGFTHGCGCECGCQR